jgi:hypothetical protein
MTQAPSAEAAVANQAIAELSPHFNFSLEHWGTHPTGKRLRIDAIAKPKNPSEWSRPDIALGIEFKAYDKDSRKDVSAIVSQCVDYSLVEWDGIGRIPIFYCPGFQLLEDYRNRTDYYDPFDSFFDSGNQTPEEYRLEGAAEFVAGFTGKNNIGELVHTYRLGWTFLFYGTHRVWSEKLGIRPGGVGEGKHNKMIRRIGSR